VEGGSAPVEALPPAARLLVFELAEGRGEAPYTCRQCAHRPRPDREGDSVSRLGPRRFAVFSSSAGARADLVVERLHEALGAAQRVRKQDIAITVHLWRSLPPRRRACSPGRGPHPARARGLGPCRDRVD